MDGKKRLLIILAVIWAGVILYDLKPSWNKPASTGAARGAALAPKLRLDLLNKPRPRYKGVVKDIFSPVKTTFAKPNIEMPPPPAIAPAPPPPPSALKIFASEAKFIGFVEKGENRTVFLSRGPDVFLVKKGDVIDGRIRVTDITDKLMTLTDEAGAEQATIALAAN